MWRPKRSIIRLWMMGSSVRWLALGAYKATFLDPTSLFHPLSPSHHLFSSHLPCPTHSHANLPHLHSAATPTFAAIISLLNSYRLTNNQPPLGFLNPFLYSIGSIGLTDIVTGSSVGCGGFDALSGLNSPLVIGAGWEAKTGWDPVTGLGTPNFETLVVAAEIEEVVGRGRRRRR